jgi:hypothetical protein
VGSNADAALRNLKWRIESTAPTHQHPRRPFRWADPRRVGPADQPAVRLFHVRWLGEEDAGDSVTDAVERRALHRYEVVVDYAADYGWLTLMDVVLQDRHDLIKTLRDPRQYVGTSATDATADIGLQSRHVTAASMDIDDDIGLATLRIEVECEVWETE